MQLMLLRFVRGVHTTAAVWKKSASSKRWLNRQDHDMFTRAAKDDSYRSRAAYKLLEMHKKHRLFRPGMTVVDLGFAPGSWSQVAVKNTRPRGRVIGVDMLMVPPPEGVTAIQGNFLSSGVQAELKRVLAQPDLGRYAPRHANIFVSEEEARQARLDHAHREQLAQEAEIEAEAMEAAATADAAAAETKTNTDTVGQTKATEQKQLPVDLVLSDMCDIWPQTSGFWVRSVNDPFYRLANTSGLIARDHGASMDLCDAALIFCIECLRPGGSFVCKFYTGSDDEELERRLKKVFKSVRRIKPEATRKESREAYFLCQRKRSGVSVSTAFPEMAETESTSEATSEAATEDGRDASAELGFAPKAKL